MYKFSILIPTRERLVPIRRVITSIYNTVHNRQDIEILIVYDIDDPNTEIELQKLKEEFKDLNISFYSRERSEFINEDYYNWLARKSTGRYIWISADDLVYLVPNWDLILWEKLEKYLADKPDKLVCANIFDNTPGPGNPPANKDEFPCFPLFSREVLDALGFLLSPQLPTWGADRYANWLFTRANRFFVINDTFYIDHVSYHTKVMEADSITTRAGEICAKYAVFPKHDFHKQLRTIEQQALRLQEYIYARKLGHA